MCTSAFTNYASAASPAYPSGKNKEIFKGGLQKNPPKPTKKPTHNQTQQHTNQHNFQVNCDFTQYPI